MTPSGPPPHSLPPRRSIPYLPPPPPVPHADSAGDVNLISPLPVRDLSNRMSTVGLEDSDKWVRYRATESTAPLAQEGGVTADQEFLDGTGDLFSEIPRCNSVPDSAVGDMDSPRPSSSEAASLDFMSDAFDTLYNSSEFYFLAD